MSSMNKILNISRYHLNTLFIKSINMARVLVNKMTLLKNRHGHIEFEILYLGYHLPSSSIGDKLKKS